MGVQGMVTTYSHSKSPPSLRFHQLSTIHIYVDIYTEQMREATVQGQVLLQVLLAKQARTSVGYLTEMVQASLFC